MAAVAPYSIRHFQLDQKGALYQLASDLSRYYCVFWWKQLPLGHLFIEPGQLIDRDRLRQQILKAIQPCIEFYSRSSGWLQTDYQGAFLHYDHETFSAAMDRVFVRFLKQEVPKRIDVSVIVCTRNRSVELRRCLESLLDQRYPPQEIIVVDNAASDDATRLVVKDFKEVIYVREPRPGLSVARNTGLRSAQASIIAFADDDVILHPLWSYRVWQTFLAAEVGAMTGQVFALSLETESQQLFEKYWGFTKGYQEKTFDATFIDNQLKKGPPVWEIGAGANMAFRKSVAEAAGGFDERLGAGASGCSEDSEMWFRILLRGCKIQYNPHAVVYHEHRKQVRALRRQLYHYARGHIVAALVQDQQKKAGYKKRVFYDYPLFYLRRLIKGFPYYRFKERTLWSEIAGWCAGVLWFLNHRAASNKTVYPSVPHQVQVVPNPQTI